MSAIGDFVLGVVVALALVVHLIRRDRDRKEKNR